jgi:hypothetical protein
LDCLQLALHRLSMSSNLLRNYFADRSWRARAMLED